MQKVLELTPTHRTHSSTSIASTEPPTGSCEIKKKGPEETSGCTIHTVLDVNGFCLVSPGILWGGGSSREPTPALSSGFEKLRSSRSQVCASHPFLPHLLEHKELMPMLLSHKDKNPGRLMPRLWLRAKGWQSSTSGAPRQRNHAAYLLMNPKTWANTSMSGHCWPSQDLCE